MSTKTSLIIWVMLFLFYAYSGGFMMSNASKSLTEASQDPSCVKPLDLYIGGFGLEDVNQQMACMGENGRAVYMGIETKQDLIYPIAYSLFLSFTLFLLTGYLFERAWPRRLLPIIPLVALVSDIVENHYLVSILQKYPDFDIVNVEIASLANQIKWGSALLAMVLVLILAISGLVKKIRGKIKA